MKSEISQEIIMEDNFNSLTNKIWRKRRVPLTSKNLFLNRLYNNHHRFKSNRFPIIIVLCHPNTISKILIFLHRCNVFLMLKTESQMSNNKLLYHSKIRIWRPLSKITCTIQTLFLAIILLINMAIRKRCSQTN